MRFSDSQHSMITQRPYFLNILAMFKPTCKFGACTALSKCFLASYRVGFKQTGMVELDLGPGISREAAALMDAFTRLMQISKRDRSETKSGQEPNKKRSVETKPAQYVPCPVCGRSIPSAFAQMHIGDCVDNRSQRTATTTSNKPSMPTTAQQQTLPASAKRSSEGEELLTAASAWHVPVCGEEPEAAGRLNAFSALMEVNNCMCTTGNGSNRVCHGRLST